MQQIPAAVGDVNKLKGQYIKNTRDQKVYKITDIGKRGVTCYRAPGIDAPTYGFEILLTWRAFKALYVILVHLTDIKEPGSTS